MTCRTAQASTAARAAGVHPRGASCGYDRYDASVTFAFDERIGLRLADAARELLELRLVVGEFVAQDSCTALTHVTATTQARENDDCAALPAVPECA